MNAKAALLILFLLLAQTLVACGRGMLSATPIPTVAVTPTVDPLEAAKVVEAFWGALEAGDLETAMVYVDEKATCAGRCYFTGKSMFRAVCQSYLDAGYITKISDVKNVGSIVTYSWEVYRNGNFVEAGRGNEMMHVENGKIVYWENQHR